jgi:outer membrane protein TolC
MYITNRRAGARLSCLGAALAVALTNPAHADHRAISALSPVLTVDQAAALAVADQPQLRELAALTSAASEAAVAARQLPDPKLVAGIQDLPIDTDTAGSFTRDSDTQIMLGVEQEFPRAEKRRLRGKWAEGEAARLDAEQQLQQRAIRRDAALAWLEVWRGTRMRQLTAASADAARTQLQAVEIALRTGRATQAEYLAMRVELGQLEDTVREADQAMTHAQILLGRWIGATQAARPVAKLPVMPQTLNLAAVLDRLPQDPRLQQAAIDIDQARTATALARADFQPDWRVELAYGHRRAFADMATLRVGIDLPLFTRDRQSRGLAAALARGEAATAAGDDLLRELAAEAQRYVHDWLELGVRLRSYDTDLLPQSAARVEAAALGWRSGRGSLREVLDARRAALDVRLARLELERDRFENCLQLRYLGACETPTATETQHE